MELQNRGKRQRPGFTADSPESSPANLQGHSSSPDPNAQFKTVDDCYFSVNNLVQHSYTMRRRQRRTSSTKTNQPSTRTLSTASRFEALNATETEVQQNSQVVKQRRAKLSLLRSEITMLKMTFGKLASRLPTQTLNPLLLIRSCRNHLLQLQDWVEVNLHDDFTKWNQLPWNSLFAMLLWGIWKERCNRLFASTVRNPTLQFTQTTTYLRDWIQATALRSFHSSDSTSLTEPNLRWLKPARGRGKLNVDAGLRSDGRASLGGVLRDHHGNWIFGFLHLAPVMSINEAELRSILTGLQVLINCSYDHIDIESDSKTAISLLSTEIPRFHPLHTIASRGQQLLQSFTSYTLSYTPRTVNAVAHSLACLAKQSDGFLHVLYNPPPVLISVLAAEAVS